MAGGRSVSVAQSAVLALCEVLPVVCETLERAVGRRLARDLVSPVDSPPFDKSMMDGYAVRSADAVSPGTILRVIGELVAGREFAGELSRGEAVRIMTGAPLPAGADAVVRLEDTDDLSPHVRLRGGVAPETNVIRRGQNLRTGERVLAAGCRLRAQELALAAELGCDRLDVYRRPRAAVLATGDELVPPGAPRGPGQITNSNESLLLAQLAGWGCDVRGLGIARDEVQTLRDRIQDGLAADLLLLTGGVSMGTRDLVPQVLAELGVREVFHKVDLKPGKPLWFGVWERSPPRTIDTDSPSRTLIFALPGNPVSSMVCSELFVRSAVARLGGAEHPIPPTAAARLTRDLPFREDRPTYLPAWLHAGLNGLLVTPTGWRGSSDIRSTIEANSLIALPAGERRYLAGETVDVWPECDALGSAWVQPDASHAAGGVTAVTS